MTRHDLFNRIMERTQKSAGATEATNSAVIFELGSIVFHCKQKYASKSHISQSAFKKIEGRIEELGKKIENGAWKDNDAKLQYLDALEWINWTLRPKIRIVCRVY